MNRSLGKKATRHDARTLRMSKYLVPQIPVPAEVSWVVEIGKWPMFLNDALGDCVLAAAGHMVQQWSHYANPPGFTPSDADVLRAYEVVGGYHPGDPNTDNGADMLTALKYWRKIGVGNHKIEAFVALDTKKPAEIMMATWLFGNAYVGLQLPNTAQTQNRWTVADGGTHTPDGAIGSWGGHCVPVMAASPKTLTCVTWGERLKMSWNFFKNYADEAYAILSPDWIERSSGLSRSNFDLATLRADLAAL